MEPSPKAQVPRPPCSHVTKPPPALHADCRPRPLRYASGLCASLPASAPRFRPAAPSFGFSMVRGSQSLRRGKWLVILGWFRAPWGEERLGTVAGRAGGLGLRWGPRGRRLCAGVQPGFSVLTPRGSRSLSAARSVSLCGKCRGSCNIVRPTL